MLTTTLQDELITRLRKSLQWKGEHLVASEGDYNLTMMPGPNSSTFTLLYNGEEIKKWTED